MIHTTINSDPTASVQQFPKGREVPIPERWSQDFKTFEELIEFGQNNSEDLVLIIEVLKKNGDTRTTHQFVNFKP